VGKKVLHPKKISLETSRYLSLLRIWRHLIEQSDALACPARFEGAAYALEALKIRLNNSRNNGFKVFIFGVA